MTLTKAILVLLLTAVTRNVAANWTEWSTWTVCTKTCGIGVSSSQRHCNNTTETSKCVGDRIRYRTCNTMDCDTGGHGDYRSLQCSEYNKLKTHRWVPETGNHLPPCALFCRAQGTDVIEMKSSKVLDGTKCSNDSYDVCINGNCEKVGCDRELHSGKRTDACGVCDGNGESCRLVTGLYRSKPEKVAGNEVVITIPQNSRHITVSSRGFGHVGLKLQDSPELDVVMPNITEIFTHGVVSRSGLVVNYGKIPYEKEYLAVPGPVPENVQVMALYDDAAWKYIRYEFYRPLTVSWIHNKTSFECTKTCGNGLRFIWPVCVDVITGEERSKKVCENEGLEAPAPKVFRCNTDPCPDSYLEERLDFSFEFLRGPHWVADLWTECSASCGGGLQTRTLQCVEDTDSGKSFISNDDGPCYDAGHLRPETKRGCNEHACPHWEALNWSVCSVTCGEGAKHRIVRCLSHDGSPGFNCDEAEKPNVMQACLVPATCHKKPLVRVPVHSSDSDSESEQAAFSGTITTISFQPSWISDRWGECSVTCGTGVVTRIVKCQKIKKYSKTIVDLSESRCDAEKKPSQSQVCSRGDCRDLISASTLPCSGRKGCFVSPQGGAGRWELGPFSECTATCGRGIRTRTVVCREIPEGSNQTTASVSSRDLPSTTMPEIMCPSPRPHHTQDCGQSSCRPEWSLKPWGKCSKPCGRGTRTRKILCVQKLGSGKIVRVSFDYCTGSPPTRKKICILKRNCPPRYEIGSWRQCPSRCGVNRKSNVQSRLVRCLQNQAGSIRPKRRGRRKCSGLQRPASVRKCRRISCHRRPTRPRIFVSRKKLIKNKFQSKLFLIIGQKATVFPESDVVIRCRVNSFPKARIRWYFNRTLLGSGARRISRIKRNTVIQKNGNLRVSHVTSRDSGFYACAAGSSFARSQLQVLSSSEAGMQSNNEPFLSSDRSRNLNSPYDAGSTTATAAVAPIRNQLDISMDQTGIGLQNSHPLSFVATPKRIVHPGVSYIESASTLEVQESQASEEASMNLLGNGDTLVGGVRQLPDIEDSNATLNENLQLIRNVLHLDTARIENRTAVPRIAIFPTKSPFYREIDVTAYVGGNLMITQAKLVTILCETMSDVPSQITWYREKEQIRTNHRFYVLREGSLRIVNPQFRDAGTYTCVASNRHGNDSKSTTLTVMRKPRIRSKTTTHRDYDSDVVDVVIGSDIRARLGAKVIIRCPSDGFPDSVVVWSKDGPGLRKNTKVLPDNSLQVYPATAADQGLFACEASNPAGSDYQASSLVLLDPPRLSHETNFFSQVNNEIGLPGLFQTGRRLKTYRIIANTSVLIGCPVTGYPEPHVTWYFNNQSLHHLGPVLDYQLLSHDRVLQIPNFGSETEGTYSCHAQNDAANLTSSLKLQLAAYMYGYAETSLCSASCGNSGIQRKEVFCLQDDVTQVDDWYCRGQIRPPFISLPCNRIDCPPKLVYGSWSSCSTACGEGESIRTPSCVVLLSNGSSIEVAIESCSINRSAIIDRKACRGNKCLNWQSGSWSPCSKKCIKKGFALRNRQINCVTSNHSIVDSTLCSHVNKPKRFTLCRNRQCVPAWVVSRWSTCSEPCGATGIQSRIVKCVYKGHKRQTATGLCSKRSKPKSRLPCNRKRCSSNTSPCENRFSWCDRMKKSRCSFAMRRACCQSCQR